MAKTKFTEAGAGTIVSTEGERARVQLIAEPGECGGGSCAACGGGCAEGLFGEPGGGRIIEVANPIDARPGDLVLLAAKPGIRISATGLLFVIPLILFLLGFVLGAEVFPDSQAAAALSAFCLAGLWYGILTLFQRRKKAAPSVWIEKVIMPGRKEAREI